MRGQAIGYGSDSLCPGWWGLTLLRGRCRNGESQPRHHRGVSNCSIRGESGDRGSGGKGGVRAPFPQIAPFFWRGVGNLFFGQRKGSPRVCSACRTGPMAVSLHRTASQQQLSSHGTHCYRGRRSIPQRGPFVTASRSLTRSAPLLRPHPTAARPGSDNWGPAASAPHCSPARPGHARSRGGPGAAE